MGCRPRARSVLHCHCVLALRDRPLSGALLAVQEGGRMEGLRLVSRQFRKHRLAVWAAGRGPDPFRTSLPWCFGSARKSGLWAELCWQCRKAGVLALRDRPLSGALLAVQEGGRMEGLNRQFRKQRLAVWAAGRGPGPHFTAMVFQLCETGLWAELCWQCRKAGEWKVWD